MRHDGVFSGMGALKQENTGINMVFPYSSMLTITVLYEQCNSSWKNQTVKFWFCCFGCFKITASKLNEIHRYLQLRPLVFLTVIFYDYMISHYHLCDLSSFIVL